MPTPSSRPARRILARAGLRPSMSRLMVLKTLNARLSCTAHELYEELREPLVSITLQCVQNTLRGLSRSGVVIRDAERRYRLEPSLLEGEPGEEALQ